MKKLIYLACAIGLTNCTESNQENVQETDTQEMNIDIEAINFGATAEGDSVTLFKLTNSQGMTLEALDYGGIITSLQVPDRDGNLGDIVLGFNTLQPYLDGHPFFGALVGRYGNRIANAEFSLDGTSYTLVKNNGENHLHGGTKGFDKVVWKTEVYESDQGPVMEMHYTSPHMEEGYPGELKVKITYLLSHHNQLKVDYEATTDQPTIVNLTQHTYFNLNPASATILDHMLTLNADYYLPVDHGLIPLGDPAEVASTPFDFTEAHKVGERIDQDHEQLNIGGGYDHTWVINGEDGQLKPAAILYDPVTGREMTVSTTEPGVQFYSANFLDGSLEGKGKPYQKHGGLCLETHHYPDSPNRPEYPTVRLDPGDTYRSTTIFSFSTR